MAADLANDKFWVNKYMYHDAEKAYYEGLAKDGVGMTCVSKDPSVKSSLAGEVAKARELIKTKMQNVDGMTSLKEKDKGTTNTCSTCKISQEDVTRLQTAVSELYACMKDLQKRMEALELKSNSPSSVAAGPPHPQKKQSPAPAKPKKKDDDDDDDDVDLFGSDSEGDEEAQKIRDQRLAEYESKKSKKPAVIAKSNIIFDVKPWNDETDMKKLEEEVRKIQMDGLVWGASKLVQVVFGIYKLQICCVIEDDKVSVDHLTEKLEEIEEYVQSVDIAAFNKV